MMLRSSSTPLLGSLLSSYSESPNHRDYETHNNNPSSDSFIKKISFTHGGNSLNFSSYSTCNNASSLTRSISGISDSSDTSSSNGFRRAQSDGNLKGLAAASSDMEDQDLFSQFSSNNNPFKSSKRTSMLQSIPSFSVYNSKGGFEDEEEEEDYEDEKDGSLQRSVTIGENIMSMGSGEFTFGDDKMGLIQEIDEDNRFNEFQYLGQDNMNPSMFLATGFGIGVNGGGSGGGGGGGFNFAKFGEGGFENDKEIGEYYKKMVEAHPSSALFLRNYAQFLYKSKGDLWGADEYYSRAVLADPRDGDILAQYARLVWELHHDYERASSYFERAVQAAPEDSHVHAAYASFLWETEDCDEEEDQQSSLSHNFVGVANFHGGALTSATA
ncbi:hypothetical protein MKW92_037002 [Papaver armeniacum]|nr:hypothetical protein MKW92_037002 [Papaver armeniacum]